MLRKEKIFLFLQEQYRNTNKQGFSAGYIADKLKLARNNVSAELNNLYREGRTSKIEGRPTLYIPLEERQINPSRERIIHQNCFQTLAGCNESLSSQVVQAQAAMLYPPKGLATLLLGETGTGKTTFAECMYRFAVANGVIDASISYVTFNCADYANTPQLLMAALFGSVKGSYTGSDSDRPGLIDKAHGGILFLDEVHRLPPEGQEMLFTIIDQGKFRRLGDVNERQADVLIIAATTQNPRSVLLETFLRRFSVVIKLPSYQDRSFQEKLAIITKFFNNEALRIKTPVHVLRDVLIALLLYAPKGNIGELKSTIELVCAKGYLDYLLTQQDIKVSLSYLPENIRNVLLTGAQQREIINEIVGFHDQVFYGKNAEQSQTEKDPYDFSQEVYDFLEKKNREYQNQELSKETIAQNLYNDLENVMSKYSRQLIACGMNELKLAKFLNSRIISAVKQLAEEILLKYNYKIKEKTFVALAFHINSMLVRKSSRSSINLGRIETEHPLEEEIASYIIERLRRVLKWKIPDDEVGFISTILFLTEHTEPDHKKIGVMVIAHGQTTASSMANVVNELLKSDHVKAINMDLQDNPADVLAKAVALARTIDQGKGILLFIDMGSLKAFGYEMEKVLGTRVVTIDNVSIPSLIEAAHKSLLPYSTVEEVAISVLELNKTLICTTIKEINKTVCRKGVIFTVCSTGEGSAIYLKDIIERVLQDNHIDHVQVIELSINDKCQAVDHMGKIAGEREIIAVAGSINPEYPGVLFLDLIEFVGGHGLERILQLVTKNQQATVKTKIDNHTVIYGMISDALDENLTFLSGKKLMPYLDNYVQEFEDRKGKKLDNNKYTALVMHVAYAIERHTFNGTSAANVFNMEGMTEFVRKVYEDFGVLLDDDDTRVIKEITEY